MDKSTEKDRNLKTLVIFGASKTGKSSIVKQFLFQTFDNEYKPTIEEVYNRKYEINGRPLDVQFIDTGGFYNFPAMRKLCIRKAAGFILVFSVTDQNSLYFLSEILAEINAVHQSDLETGVPYTSRVPLVVLGNKIDNHGGRSVTDGEIDNWLDVCDVTKDKYYHTSAREEDGIWDAFTSLYHQYEGLFPSVDGGTNTKQTMGLNIRRLSAFAALAASPTQFKSFFNSHINPELVQCTSTASSSLSSSSGGCSPGYNATVQRSTSPMSALKIKRNSRPSLAKAKETFKYGKIKEPVKLDCTLS